jgi:hypothetical protein
MIPSVISKSWLGAMFHFMLNNFVLNGWNTCKRKLIGNELVWLHGTSLLCPVALAEELFVSNFSRNVLAREILHISGSTEQLSRGLSRCLQLVQ